MTACTNPSARAQTSLRVAEFLKCQSYEPPEALVAEVEAFAPQAVEPLRDGETFAAAVATPPSATPIQRLVAFTLRRP